MPASLNMASLSPTELATCHWGPVSYRPEEGVIRHCDCGCFGLRRVCEPSLAVAWPILGTRKSQCMGRLMSSAFVRGSGCRGLLGCSILHGVAETCLKLRPHIVEVFFLKESSIAFSLSRLWRWTAASQVIPGASTRASLCPSRKENFITNPRRCHTSPAPAGITSPKQREVTKTSPEQRK